MTRQDIEFQGITSHAEFVGYIPETAGNWSTAPSNVHQALDELAASSGGITGSGTAGYLPEFTGASAIGNSPFESLGTLSSPIFRFSCSADDLDLTYYSATNAFRLADSTGIQFEFAYNSTYGAQLAMGHTTHGTINAGDMLEIRNLDGGDYGAAVAAYGFIGSGVNPANISPVIRLGKGRGSWTSPAAIQDGDNIGTMVVQGYHSGWRAARGRIAFQASSPTSSNCPTDIVFSTGSSSLTERWRTQSDGNTLVASTNEWQFSNSSQRIWSPTTGYLGLDGGTAVRIYTAGVQRASFVTRRLVFDNAGIDPEFEWATSNQITLAFGATEVMRWGSGPSWGVFGTSAMKQTVTGTLASASAVCQSILSALVNYGIVTDGTS